MQVSLTSVSTSHWRPEHVAAIGDFRAQTIPQASSTTPPKLFEGLYLWDMWPLQQADGRTANYQGWTIWFILSSPAIPDPDLRHGIARIRLVTEKDGQWVDCGNALPDGLNPGSREWAGSAIVDADGEMVTLFYTVAGYPGETETTYAQRLFQTSGKLAFADGKARITNWSAPAESVKADGRDYMIVDQKEGVPGFIKGFRDPAFFRDPASGRDYLLFTGSLAGSQSAWNGCIGIAEAQGEALNGWQLLPPLVSADGLNNEQERPHIVVRDGLYYLFWSTQRKVFEPSAPNGPNGLYAMVAPSLFGPYEPVNGTGLVAANPDAEQFQHYSWWVMDDLQVAGFVDLVGVGNQPVVDDPAWRRAHFGGVPAPRFRIALDGTRAWVDQV
ncbi:MAG: glycoside hydrolase family 68 protein [Pseudomonadota bacterium]